MFQDTFEELRYNKIVHQMVAKKLTELDRRKENHEH